MIRNVLTAVVGAALLVACGNAPVQEQAADEGGVYLSARGSALLFEANITCVGVIIQATGIPAVHGQMFNSNPGVANGSWQFRLDKLPVGNAYVTARAYAGPTVCDDGNPGAGAALYQVENQMFVIAKNTTTIGTLWLQETQHADPFKNSAPYITSLLASSGFIALGEEILLNVTAVDPDPGQTDTLTYAWSISPASTTTIAAVKSPTWTAPNASGTYTLTIKVTDVKGSSASADIDIVVSDAYARGSLQADVFMNNWPRVLGLTSSTDETPAGQPFQLQATATDADNDGLNYAWAVTGCEGGFTGTGAMVSFTPGVNDVNHVCKIVVTVTDLDPQGLPRGGSGTGEIDVTVKVPVVGVGPQFMIRWLSPFTLYNPDGVLDGNKRAEVVAIPLDNVTSNKTFTWDDSGHGGHFVYFTGADTNGEPSDKFYVPAACTSPGTFIIPITSYVTDNATFATNFATVNMTVICQ